MSQGYGNQDTGADDIKKRFAGNKTTGASLVSSSGDTTVVNGAGKRLRLYWIGLSASNNNTSQVLVTVKLGSNVIYKWYLVAGSAFMHWEPVSYAVGDSLIINLDSAQSVQVNYTYEEI